MLERSFVRWTHPSVHLLAKGHRDPVAFMRERARSIAMGAMDEGWSGPPFDPIDLAERLGLAVKPVADLPDARIVRHSSARALIEFNPNRARGRVRYSIAHEIGHYLFPDCLDAARHRLAQHEVDDPRDWQVEMLCNVAAAEFLMPVGSFPDLGDVGLDIDDLMKLRMKYEVSSEALLLRVVHLVQEPCLMFAARRVERGADAGRYRLDYAVAERGFSAVGKGFVLPDDSAISHCTAIGYTAKGREQWTSGQVLWVEAVGVPPYPGFRHPRVVGLARAETTTEAPQAALSEVRGDALSPRGTGPRVVVHLVNDRTENWGGGGFANALARRWPAAQRRFREWIHADRSRLRLGSVHLADVGEGTYVATVVAQKGYGPSRQPRVRYAALDAGLRAVALEADARRATVHMPRIGTGLAGGSWWVIREIVETCLVARGIAVTVYTPPDVLERRAQAIQLPNA